MIEMTDEIREKRKIALEKWRAYRNARRARCDAEIAEAEAEKEMKEADDRLTDAILGPQGKSWFEITVLKT
jgi:hypothetical protein